MVYGSACKCHADLVLSDYLVYYSCVHATDNANFFSLLSAIHVIADIDPFYFFLHKLPKELVYHLLTFTGDWTMG